MPEPVVFLRTLDRNLLSRWANEARPISSLASTRNGEPDSSTCILIAIDSVYNVLFVSTAPSASSTSMALVAMGPIGTRLFFYIGQ